MKDFILTAIFKVQEPEKPQHKGKIFGYATLKLALG